MSFLRPVKGLANGAYRSGVLPTISHSTSYIITRRVALWLTGALVSASR
jgi:hypothetical protein